MNQFERIKKYFFVILRIKTPESKLNILITIRRFIQIHSPFFFPLFYEGGKGEKITKVFVKSHAIQTGHNSTPRFNFAHPPLT